MKWIIALMLACLSTPAIAGDFDYEAEAALALASVKLKPTPTLATAPCEFCGAACKCQNCGCDAHYKKGTAAPAATFQLQQSGCANGQCNQPEGRRFRLFPR